MLKNEVNYKALSFLAEQTSSTFNYEVKGVRALWDPSLSIPGTNRRGGWRCPVGTRYGGQITDRFGRSCGWGVARRIANQIADIGERLESIDDRKRGNRLGKRNARMQRFLARQDKPGLLERGARGLADALDGGETGKPITAPRAPARPRIPVQPPARPIIPVQNPASIEPPARKPAGVPRRRGNLRESEARRVERELVQPGAPRTGEPPAPNAQRRRRRNAAQQGAKRTARRKPEADFVDGSKPAPTKVPRRKPAPKPPEPPKPSTPIPDPPAWNPTADELGGSVPDDASIRNVRNRFGDLRGLPEDAYWRKPDFPEGEEKGELERRFGRYYDDDNKRNARGNFVNQQIFGQQAGAPQPQPPAPARPAGPPAIRKQLDTDAEFNKPEDAAMLQIVKDDIAHFKPNAHNNLRNLDKDALNAKRNELKQEQLVFDEEFDRAVKNWRDSKDGVFRGDARNNLLGIHGRREKNFEALKAVDMRIVEVDAGIAFQPKPPNNAGIRIEAPIPAPVAAGSSDIQGEFANADDHEKRVLTAALLDIDNKKFRAQNEMALYDAKDKDSLQNKIDQLKTDLLVAEEKLKASRKVWDRYKNNSQQRRGVAEVLITDWRDQELIRNKIDVMEQRMKDIDAGKPWIPPQPRNEPQGINRVPRPRPSEENVDPVGGYDVSPPSAKKEHKPELLAALGKDGLPDVGAIPIGNKGLDTKEKSAKHLEDGGNLADVPDDFLGFAIKNSPKRFEERQAGGGVNGGNGNMSLHVDKTNGKQYYLKYQNSSVSPNEDLHEMVGNNLAGRLGMPVGGVRFDGKQPSDQLVRNGWNAEKGRAILYEHAGNYVEGALTAGRDADLAQIKVSDRVRATVLDFVIANVDRHGGNFFVSTDENGKRRFVPIDPSLGFDAVWNMQPHEDQDGNDDGLKSFLARATGGGRNNMLATLRAQYLNGQISRREVTASLRDLQESIREAEAKNPYMNMVEDALKSAGDGGTANKRTSNNTNERIKMKPMRKLKYITDKDPALLADIVLGIIR